MFVLETHFQIGQQLSVAYHKVQSLGPILFIIYINDLVEYCGSNADIFLFADDAKIFSHIKTDQDIKQLQCEVVSFKNWMDTMATQIKCKQVRQ